MRSSPYPPPDGMSFIEYLAAARLCKTCHHLHPCRLAASVLAEQSVDLPLSRFSVRSATASFDPNHFVSSLHSSIIFSILLIICDLIDNVVFLVAEPAHLMHKVFKQL